MLYVNSYSGCDADGLLRRLRLCCMPGIVPGLKEGEQGGAGLADKCRECYAQGVFSPDRHAKCLGSVRLGITGGLAVGHTCRQMAHFLKYCVALSVLWYCIIPLYIS